MMYLLVLLFPWLIAASPVSNYTVQEPTYIWNASGTSATQGSGSIAGWPAKTGGTASCSLSQVTTSPTGTMPTVSGTAIKIDCVAGAAPTAIGIRISIPNLSLQAVGNFGFYWYDPTGDSTTSYSGPNALIATDDTLANRFSFACSNVTTATGRRKGWNLCTWQRGDQTATVGTANYDSSTFTRIDFQFTPLANQTFTVYLGDFVKGWYTKPQIMLWNADNGIEAYTSGFAYTNDVSRKIPASYMPTTNYLASPSGSQITVSQLLDMQSNGWSIIPHQTIGTALTSMTESQMEAEIGEVLRLHRQYGFKSQVMLYPSGGSHNDLSDSVMSRYGLRYGNNANTGNVTYGRPVYSGLINPYNLWNYTMTGGTLANAKIAINNTIKYGGYLGMLIHNPTGADLTLWQGVVDYLLVLRNANVVDVVNYETFFKRLASSQRTN